MEQSSRDIVGGFVVPTKNIALIASRFNEMAVERLLQGAKDILIRHGVKAQNIDCIWVPGAFELPLACQQVAQTNRFSGIVALGAVIRGDTAHFDYVAGSCANGITQVQLKTGVPIAFGVLTTETLEQAFERSGTTAGNKGSEAAMALLEMMDVLGRIND